MVIQELDVDAQLYRHREPLCPGHPEVPELNGNQVDDNSVNTVFPKVTLHFLGFNSTSLPISPGRQLIQS